MTARAPDPAEIERLDRSLERARRGLGDERLSLKLGAELSRLNAALSAAKALAKRSPEFRDKIAPLLDDGDGLVTLREVGSRAAGASELIIRLDPSDAFLGLLAAYGADDPDGLIFEHPNLSNGGDAPGIGGGVAAGPQPGGDDNAAPVRS